MIIGISLMDFLFDFERSWIQNSLASSCQKEKDSWISRCLTNCPDRVLESAIVREDAKDCLTMLFDHPIEPSVIYWIQGEDRKGIARIFDEWLRERDLHADGLVISDNIHHVFNIWKIDLLITRSKLIAFDAAQRGNIISGLLPGFPLEEILISPEQFFPDFIYPVNSVETLSNLIGELDYAYHQNFEG